MTLGLAKQGLKLSISIKEFMEAMLADLLGIVSWGHLRRGCLSFAEAGRFRAKRFRAKQMAAGGGRSWALPSDSEKL